MSLGRCMWPVHDALATVVMQGRRPVRDVLVAGRFAKRDGRLLRPTCRIAQARRVGRAHPGALDMPSISRNCANEERRENHASLDRRDRPWPSRHHCPGPELAREADHIIGRLHRRAARPT
jgi:hypothetical protein